MVFPDCLGKHILPRITSEVPLKAYTTFDIGGPGRWLLETGDEEELYTVWDTCREAGVSLLVLGEGSNVLVDDRGFPGLILINRVTSLAVTPGADGRCLVRCGSGLLLRDLVQQTISSGLAGLESLAGIPGTVGGAVYGNAGAYGREICSMVHRVLLACPGKVPSWISRDAMLFTYRSSRVKVSGGLIIAVELLLDTGDTSALTARCEEVLELRRQKLPELPAIPSAGSFFKNLPPEKPGDRRRSAGKLLAEAGVHGMKIGGAAVFEKHANIIVNLGSASSCDVRNLADSMKSRVQERFGIRLEEEVRCVGYHRLKRMSL